MDHIIRPFRTEDEAEVINVWQQSGDAIYTFLPSWNAHTQAENEAYFRDTIVKNCRLWVGILEEDIIGYLAMNRSYIDRLYIHPDHQRQGWGSAFVAKAREQSPAGLELHTHQENHQACAFYEKHGFTVFKLGISPPPELAPDVEYHWRPEPRRNIADATALSAS